MVQMKEYYDKFISMKTRKDRLEVEENILIGLKSHYETYFQFEKFFEPHYLLWTTAEEFIDSKKKWKSVAASSLDMQQITKLKSKTINNLRKLKNKFEGKQKEVMDGLHRQIRDLDSWLPIIEYLSNPGLKARHWEEIHQISGPDLDFAKLSVDRIKFLKLEYLLDGIASVSEIASQEYSLEKYLDSMENDLNAKKAKLSDHKDRVEFKQLIDEQIGNIKALRSNKHIGPLLDRVEKWSEHLNELKRSFNQDMYADF